MKGMQKEQRPYTGILYIGLIVTKKGVKIIEFNARWGDPEAEVLLPSITTDYYSLVVSAIEKRLNETTLKNDGLVRMSIAGCSHGYPADYSAVKGKRIFGLTDARKFPGITVYGAGISKKGKDYTANGGRIFHLVSKGKTVKQARIRAYGAMSMIYIEGDNLHYRTDVGWREIERMTNF
jgi:phosphoribosylamine--glycine ligase